MQRSFLGLVVVLGRGRLGTTLAAGLKSAEIPGRLVPARDRGAIAEAITGADLVVLAVPDSAIATMADTILTAAGTSRPAVVHLSGALDKGELQKLAVHGFPIGTFHPFLPFSTSRLPEVFHGATVGIDASESELEVSLASLARAIGAHPCVVVSEKRALYHAAAVIGSSYVVALVAQAADLLEDVGFGRREALRALLPLLRATLENLETDGLPGALSGPLRRGDSLTIARHVEALEMSGYTAVRKTYCVVGESAVELAMQLGLSRADADLVRRTLSDHGG